MLRHAGKAAKASVYIAHPDGGYVLWAHDRDARVRASSAAVTLFDTGKATRGGASRPDIRFWWNGPAGWLWGGDGYYFVAPLGYEGRTGAAVVGPHLNDRFGPRRARAVQHALNDAGRMLIKASTQQHNDITSERAAAESAARSLMAGGAPDLLDVVLRAIRFELMASDVEIVNGALVVHGAQRSPGASLPVLERAVRRLLLAGDDRVMRLRTLQALAEAVDARAAHTVGHSARVSEVATLIAQEAGWDPVICRTVQLAGMFHDVAQGFCGTAALTTIKLDDAEREAMKRHPELGAAIVIGAGMPTDIAAGVRGHHERWDGTGYPDRLVGEAIPLQARPIAIAEVFDALVSARPWRPALSLDKALGTIRDAAGLQFDPELVAAFLGSYRRRLAS